MLDMFIRLSFRGYVPCYQWCAPASVDWSNGRMDMFDGLRPRFLRIKQNRALGPVSWHWLACRMTDLAYHLPSPG